MADDIIAQIFFLGLFKQMFYFCRVEFGLTNLLCSNVSKNKNIWVKGQLNRWNVELISKTVAGRYIKMAFVLL